MPNTSIQNTGYNPSKNFFKLPNLIAVIRRKAKMVRSIETTIQQGVRNVLFQFGREIYNVCIGQPRIFELADVETEWCSHHSEAINPQLHVCVSDAHLEIAAIADKKS